RFPDVPQFAAGNLGLNYHRAGKPGPDVDNVGIVTFNAARDDFGAGKVQAFVRVLNFRKDPASLRVQLEARVDGRLRGIREEPLTLPGRRLVAADEARGEPAGDRPGEGAATFDLADLDDSARVELHARLLGVSDQFPLDDEAWLVVGIVRKARVLIVTDGNEILRDFFGQEATDRVANVTY